MYNLALEPKFEIIREDVVVLPNDEYYDPSRNRWIKVPNRYVGSLYKSVWEYLNPTIVRRKCIG